MFMVQASSCTPFELKGGKQDGNESDDEDAIYVSPEGKSMNTGTIDSPFDIHTAITRVRPGETIYVRGGTYYLVEPLRIDRVATEKEPIELFAYGNEKPVFDCSKELVSAYNNMGLRIGTGQWWHIRGIEVCNARNSGFMISDGSHIVFENCVAHHNGGTGFTVGYGHSHVGNDDGQKGAYLTFLNCDSYNNFDWWTVNSGIPAAGTNADGFAVKCKAGKGNRFIGCRGWSNSDDNWDFFECGFGVEIINCWAWRAGHMDDHKEMYLDRTGEELTETVWLGDGNGFKMGGGCLHMGGGRDCQLESLGTHVFRNCVSFDNSLNGFDQNNHRYGAFIENCLSFGNQCNYQFYKENMNATSFVFRNNVTYGGTRVDNFSRITIAFNEGNLWNATGLTSTPLAEFTQTCRPKRPKLRAKRTGRCPTGSPASNREVCSSTRVRQHPSSTSYPTG